MVASTTPNVAVVGNMLATAMQHAVPNVERYYPGQNGDFMNLVMDHLAGMGVPGAAGLRPSTPVLGSAGLPTLDFAAALNSVGKQNSGPTGGRGA